MRTRQNYGWLDRFRVIVALLAITNHTSALSSINDTADFFLTRVLARIVVPFFLMVTGQFVAADFLTISRKNGPRLIKYIKKTSLYYLLSILLYLPIGIYAKQYQGMSIGGALRLLIFDGTFYHLWYFPACIMGMLLIYLMSRKLSLRTMTVISAILYIIGLFGDSYYGLAEKVPVLNAVYEFGFHIFSYTRNGLFIAPLFLVLGIWMSVLEHKREENSIQEESSNQVDLMPYIVGLTASFAVMTIEAFTLRHFQLQRHDSMYFALVPTMFFLYQCLLCLPKKPSISCRTASTWIYILHPAFIVVVRAIAKLLKRTDLLVDNSVVLYLTVTCLSVAAALVIVYIEENLLPRLRPGQNGTTESDNAAQDHGRMKRLQRQQPPLTLDSDTIDIEQDENLEASDFQGDEAFEASDFQEGEAFEVSGLPADAAFEVSDLPGDAEFEVSDAAALPKTKTAKTIASQEERSSAAFGRQKQKGTDAARQLQNYGSIPSSTSRARIELDTAALARNVEFLRSCLPKDCRLMPAVKAEAYGHGAVIIARLLNQLNVDAFCVACLSEGIALREAGIKGEILILGYTAPVDLPLLVRYELTQTVVDYPYAQMLEQSGLTLHVHVAIDTGMHRLGLRCENVEEILAVYQMEHLVIDGLFTHLSASDSLLPQDKLFTDNQITAFYQVVTILKSEGYSCHGLHMLASYGILNLLQEKERTSKQIPSVRPAADYVRPGIALYGVLSTETDSNTWWNSLQPVLSLKARVASTRILYAGEAAGYGLAYTAAQDMRIATISIGYADGLPRELSYEKGCVLIDGCRAPIIGRICMDQTIVDISNIPHVKAGDIAVIIGKSKMAENTAGQLAENCGTITNELLSRLSLRLERITIS